MIDEVFLATDERMQKSIGAMKREFNNIRSGRATPSLVDNIKVDAYELPLLLTRWQQYRSPRQVC